MRAIYRIQVGATGREVFGKGWGAMTAAVADRRRPLDAIGRGRASADHRASSTWCSRCSSSLVFGMQVEPGDSRPSASRRRRRSRPRTSSCRPAPTIYVSPATLAFFGARQLMRGWGALGDHPGLGIGRASSFAFLVWAAGGKS